MAIVVVGTGFAPSLVAGIPNRCDMARIAARGVILSKYEQLVSELDRLISKAKADGKDSARSATVESNGETRSVDIASLTAELDAQERRDLGHADRQVSKGCVSDDNAVENARQTAESVAALGMSTILSKYGVSDLSRISPPS
ncbi:MAG: hypothetical protein JOY66_04145 [Acetobacteraceae bacterium]|nr:hypothetical protein [Acetobacteraceae bacterium]